MSIASFSFRRDTNFTSQVPPLQKENDEAPEKGIGPRNRKNRAQRSSKETPHQKARGKAHRDKINLGRWSGTNPEHELVQPKIL